MSRLSAIIRDWRARRTGGVSEIVQPASDVVSEATPDPVPENLPEEHAVPEPGVHGPQRLHIDWSALRNAVAVEYPDLASSPLQTRCSGPRPVFITARFRSGSTLLWNLLRHTPGITAYYEPLHPTLQFPPEQRVPALDPTHDGVEEYWAEYERIDGLAAWYTEPWHNRGLYLDTLSWQPALAEYLRVLIRSARELPVLQFNRVDFRLSWLRHVFPEAHLVHLFRNPRDQWLSALRPPAAFGPHAAKEGFAEHDHFFLGEWVTDLAVQFPLLNWQHVEHPYGLFYMLWKLSYVWGKTYSDLSIAYEQLLAAPHKTVSQLFDLLELDQQLVAQVVHLVHPKGTGKWRTYADASWFAAHESAAETLLDAFLGRATGTTSAKLRAAG